jgi:hypothetical protein
MSKNSSIREREINMISQFWKDEDLTEGLLCDRMCVSFFFSISFWFRLLLRGSVTGQSV